MNSVTVYTATGDAVTLYREPPATPVITTQTNAMPTVSDIMAMAQPGERVTVSYTVERTSTAATGYAAQPDEYGIPQRGSSKNLLLAMVMIAAAIAFAKLVEVISTHPLEFAGAVVAVICLTVAVLLVRGGKTQ